jgi:hypothetical protein
MPNPPSSGLPNPQTYASVGAESVLDRVTCLEWQRAVPSGTYTQAGAIAYCQQLVLDGHDDWRLPARIELVTLVDYTRTNPSIDSAAFPGTPNARFWSSTAMQRTAGMSWRVSFADGVTTWEPATSMWHARCVRSLGAAPLVQRYTIGTGAAGGTVFDAATQLTWTRTTASERNWPDAVSFCTGLGAGWRLPSMTEIQSLVDDARSYPAIDTTAFPGTLPRGYWTSSPWAEAPTTYAWRADFYDGITNNGAPITTWLDMVRCVR